MWTVSLHLLELISGGAPVAGPGRLRLGLAWLFITGQRSGQGTGARVTNSGHWREREEWSEYGTESVSAPVSPLSSSQILQYLREL